MINHFESKHEPDCRIKHIEEIDRETLERYLRLLGPENFGVNKGIDIPDDPTFLKVAELRISGAKIEGQPGALTDITLRDVNAFFCHVDSNNDGMWTVKGNISIPELLAEFRKKHDLCLSLTCNRGSFRLADDLIYPIGKPAPIPCCFNREGGIILEAHLAFEHEDFRPVFHIPEKYQTKK